MDEGLQQKQKVLYIITKSNFGGAQKHVFDLAVHLPNDKFEVVVTLGGSGILKDKLEAAQIRTVSISTMGRDISFFKDIASFFKVFSVIRKERPDVLHLHSPKAAGLGALSGRILGVKKIIYTVHGWAFNEDRNLFSKWLILFFSWLTTLCAHTIVTITERETNQTKKFPFVSKKIKYIPNGINIPEYINKEDAVRFFSEKIRRDISAQIIIGTISELHKSKGLTYAIDAVSKLLPMFPSLVFLIVSDGEEKKYLEKYIKERNLENNVYLLGYVADAARYIKGFSVFTLTSIKEGLPYVILEAGAAQVPCVATSVGGIPDVIHDMQSGILVKTKNANEIAHGIHYMLSNESKAQKFAAELHNTVVTQFSIDTMLNNIITLYLTR